MENITEDIVWINSSIKERPSNTVYVTNAVFTLLATAVCIFGNTLVIVSIAKFRYLRSTTNVFVVLLACYDLSLGLIAIFEQFVILRGVFHDEMDTTLCKTLAGLTFAIGMGDMLSVMYMAVDRYIYIKYPLKYPNIVTYKRVVIAVIFSIVYIPLSKIPTVLYTRSLDKDTVCNIISLFDSVFTLYLLLPEIGVISTVLVVLYLKIAFIACRSVQQDPARHACATQPATYQARAQLKVTKVISMVIGVYGFTNVVGAICLVTAVMFDTALAQTLLLLFFWIWKV